MPGKVESGYKIFLNLEDWGFYKGILPIHTLVQHLRVKQLFTFCSE